MGGSCYGILGKSYEILGLVFLTAECAEGGAEGAVRIEDPVWSKSHDLDLTQCSLQTANMGSTFCSLCGFCGDQ